MKRLSFLLLLSVVLAGGLAGCDLLDPTNVENPNITQEEFLNSADPMSTWLIGMNRQLAIALNTVIVPAEIASDNYVNTQTYYNTLMDRLTLLPTDNDIEDALTEVSQLRETAVFGLNEVAEADEDESPTQLAELWFYKGYAHLLTGEVFHLAPADSAGEPLPAEAHYQLAVDAFEEAITLTQDASRKVGYQIALARAYRLLGQRAEAVAAARAALDADQD